MCALIPFNDTKLMIRPPPAATMCGKTLRVRSVVGAEQQGARGHAGSGGDEHVLDPVDLVHRRAPHLAHAFGDAVHAVDVRLAELATVRVDREAAAELDVAVAEELLGLAPRAESELFELRQYQRREVVVDNRRLDVVGTEPG